MKKLNKLKKIKKNSSKTAKKIFPYQIKHSYTHLDSAYKQEDDRQDA